MNAMPIGSMLILEDDDDVRRLLVSRLRLLPICEGMVLWATGLAAEAIEFVAERPEIALLDLYAPQLDDHRYVRGVLQRRSPTTRCLVMTDTAQANPWLIAETELAGANFIEKQRLLLGPPDGLHSILLTAQQGAHIPWSAPIRQAMATVVNHYAHVQRRSRPLDSGLLVGVAPRFSTRAKDFIRILQLDPGDDLTYVDFANRMGLASEQSVRDYPGRITKIILQELDWLDNGELLPEGAQELIERGLMKAGDPMPQLTRALVRALLDMIQFTL